MKENLGWESQEAFYVPDDVYKHYEELAKERAASENTWNLLFEDYCKAFPEMKELWDKYYNGCDMSDLFNSLSCKFSALWLSLFTLSLSFLLLLLS